MNNSLAQISWSGALRFFLVGTGFAALWFLRDIIALILSAIVIAAAVEAPVSTLMRKKWPRFAAVSLVYLTGLVALFMVFYIAVPMIISQTRDLAGTLLGTLRGLQVQLLAPGLENFLNNIAENFTAIFPAIGRGAGQVLTFLSGAAGMAFGAILVLVISFYLSLQDGWVKKSLAALAPKQHEEYLSNLWKRTERKIGRWLYAQAIISLIVGALVFIVLSFLRVESALILAILAGVFNIVPIAGSLAAGLIAFLVAIQQGFAIGIYTLVLFVIVQQLEAYVLSPAIQRKAIGLSPIMIIFSLLVGVRVAGFWGFIIAIPLAAAVSEIYIDFERRLSKG